MKTIVFLLCLLAASAYALAASTDGQLVDANGTKVQGFAPRAGKDVTLSGSDATVNNSADVAWQIAPTADCTFYTMSTATVAGTAKPLYAGQAQGRVINPFYKSGARSAYTRFIGCTGVVERH